MRSRKEQITKRQKYSLRFYFSLLIVILVVGYPIYFLVKSVIGSNQLFNNSKLIRAVVVNEKNYVGHSPVEHKFYYSYEFVINGKSYRGNTMSSIYRVGDSIDVRYSISNPSFSEIANKD